MRYFRKTIICVLILVMTGVLFGQQPKTNVGIDTSSGQAKDSILKLGTNLVSIPVSVVDRNGRYAAHLESSNFEVYDEGIKQNIEMFAQEDSPLAIGIVYDVSGSMQTAQSRALSTLRQFLDRLRGGDEFFIVGVSTQPFLVTDFTNDPSSIET